jgi:hypothetical protein
VKFVFSSQAFCLESFGFSIFWMFLLSLEFIGDDPCGVWERDGMVRNQWDGHGLETCIALGVFLSCLSGSMHIGRTLFFAHALMSCMNTFLL